MKGGRHELRVERVAEAFLQLGPGLPGAHDDLTPGGV